METKFDIGGKSFDSLADLDDAAKWTVVDRQFPDGLPRDAMELALVRATQWLKDNLPGEPRPDEDAVVRCVVRLATHCAESYPFRAAAPSPAVVSNPAARITLRLSGQQDRDEAHRRGYPDVESYRLVSGYYGRGGEGGVGSFDVSVTYNPVLGWDRGEVDY